jgi:hypothetical protein
MNNPFLGFLEFNFRVAPSDASFAALYEFSTSHESYSLSDFLHSSELSRFSADLQMRIKADAFVLEGRYLEASFFCKKWLEVDPTSWECWRLTGILAGKTGNFSLCKSSIEKLESLNAPDSTKWLVATIFRLVFTGGSMADRCANAMLSSLPVDRAATATAVNAAVVCDNEDLLYRVLLQGADFSVGTRSAKKIELLMRRKFISVLRARVASSNNG